MFVEMTCHSTISQLKSLFMGKLDEKEIGAILKDRTLFLIVLMCAGHLIDHVQHVQLHPAHSLPWPQSITTTFGSNSHKNVSQ